jgi:hypothetical protein
MRSLPVNSPLRFASRRGCRIVCTLLLQAGCMCVVSTAVRAQALGVITGSVTDPTGAAVPRAHVTAMETGTGFERSITTDDTGHYTVPSLRPTEYSLTVEASGFAKYVQRSVRLIADQTATIDVQLKVGSTAETMTVSAIAADAPLVDAATPTLTDVIGNTRIEELPLNGRAVDCASARIRRRKPHRCCRAEFPAGIGAAIHQWRKECSNRVSAGWRSLSGSVLQHQHSVSFSRLASGIQRTDQQL